MEFILAFSFGLVACFIGALPFGAINLSVVAITIKDSYNQGIRFAIGSSFVEIAEAYIALAFGMYINSFLENYTFIPYSIALAFLLIGTYFFIRKTAPSISKNKRRGSNAFTQGILIALTNPQAIPFWLFALASISPYKIIHLMGIDTYWFLAGVFIGKLIALSLFAKVSGYLEKHLSKSCHTIDYIMGSVFVLIGLLQVARQIIDI